MKAKNNLTKRPLAETAQNANGADQVIGAAW
jgi:hypothetical protein